MNISSAFFRRRLTERLCIDRNDVAAPVRRANLVSGWDPEKVLEFLRQELDTGHPHMERVIIVGVGGHAKVIFEILEESGEVEIAGFTNREAGGQVMGVPVLGTDSVLPDLYARGIRHAFVALGDNRARAGMTRRLQEAGFSLINAISRRAVISPRARLGCGIAVMPGAVINAASEIGDGAIVNTGATVDHDCRIGAYAHVAPGVNLAGCVTVGEGAIMGLGSRAIPGITVGAWTVVGAGAVVVRDLPEAVTAVGVPAAVRPRTA